MTPAEARSRLVAMGVDPAAAALAEIGGEARVPKGVETVYTLGSRPANDAAHTAGPVSPSCWTIRIPGWHPPSLNRLIGGHWAQGAKLKKAARYVILAAVLRHGVPKATGRRRLSMHLVYPPKLRMLDEDNVWKAVRDGLVHCGALRDDSPKWVESTPATFSRGERAETYITVEEMG